MGGLAISTPFLAEGASNKVAGSVFFSLMGVALSAFLIGSGIDYLKQDTVQELSAVQSDITQSPKIVDIQSLKEIPGSSGIYLEECANKSGELGYFYLLEVKTSSKGQGYRWAWAPLEKSTILEIDSSDEPRLERTIRGEEVESYLFRVPEGSVVAQRAIR